MEDKKAEAQPSTTSRRTLIQGIGALAGGMIAPSAFGPSLEAAAAVAPQGASASQTNMSAGARFRTRMNSGEPQMMPIVGDMATGKIADILGFPLLIVGGGALASAKLLTGDWGMLQPDDLSEFVSRLSMAVDASIMIDGDDGGGLGGPLNVYRAVEKYERAGAGAVMIEDLTGVKHMGRDFPEGPIISKQGLVDKVHAAVDARRDSTFCVCVRTDVMVLAARNPAGRERAVVDMHDRLQAGIEAGADIVFAAGMPADQIEIAMQRTGKPIIAGGLSLEAARQKKVNIMLVSDPVPGPAWGLIYALLKEAKETGSFDADTFPALPADVRRKMLDSDAVEARVRKYNVFEGR